MISSSVPATGDGISVSTLSVETSSSGSSTSTFSPTSFSQRVTVPSVTLSPSAGSVTVGALGRTAPAAGACGARRAGSAAGASAAGPSARRPAVGLLGRSACCCGAASAAPVAAVVVDDGQLGADLDGLVLGDLDRGSARRRRGDGISVSTLSVDTSSSGSSASTRSPSAFSQRVTVPSVTLSPSAGQGYGNRHVFQTPSCPLVRIIARAPDAADRRGQSWECSGLPARARWASPSASFCVGWAWMSCATSAGSASQL